MHFSHTQIFHQNQPSRNIASVGTRVARREENPPLFERKKALNSRTRQPHNFHQTLLSLRVRARIKIDPTLLLRTLLQHVFWIGLHHDADDQHQPEPYHYECLHLLYHTQAISNSFNSKSFLAFESASSLLNNQQEGISSPISADTRGDYDEFFD